MAEVDAMETWKEMEGFEERYIISSEGRTARLLHGALARGYRRVLLRKNGKQSLVAVHRIVVEAFIGPISDELEVNHKNGIRSDNRLENLEIVTPSQNQKHAFRELGKQKMQGSKHGRSKLTEEQVLEIRRLGSGRERGIGNKLAIQFGVGPQTISFILNRRIWTHI